MNENQLSKRLEQVSMYIPEKSRLADIGSDHAYLPVVLALQGKISYAVAGEVVKGPYKAAINQVEKNGLTKKINVRLANGLDAIETADEIDTITICGMGGTLIRNILDIGWKKQKIRGNELLILQPNVGEKTLRDWLTDHGYTIISETILEENEKIYEIIVAKRLETRIAYSQKELRCGPLLLKEASSIFKNKWDRELKQRKRILKKLQQATVNQDEKIHQLTNEIAEIKEALTGEN